MESPEATWFNNGDGTVQRKVGNATTTFNMGFADRSDGIWALDDSEVYVAANEGIFRVKDGTPEFVHSFGPDRKYLAVWGTGPNDIVAVGTPGHIERFDGSTWNLEASPVSDPNPHGGMGLGTKRVLDRGE